MATLGSCSTSAYNSKKWVNFNWSRTDTQNDDSYCRSKIYFQMKGGGTDSTTWHWSGPVKIWIYKTSGGTDENVYYNEYLTSRVQLKDGTWVGDGEFWIDHTNSGSGSFRVYIEAAIYSSSINCYGSGAWDLDYLPRQANITRCDNFNSNANPYMEFSNPRWTYL